MKSELYKAIEEKNTPKALELIAQGEDVNSGGTLGDSTNKASNLFLAIHNHDTAIALALVNKGAIFSTLLTFIHH